MKHLYDETKVLQTYQSESNHNRFYTVYRDRDGIISCDCPSWKFQSKPSHSRDCKHKLFYMGAGGGVH